VQNIYSLIVNFHSYCNISGNFAIWRDCFPFIQFRYGCRMHFKFLPIIIPSVFISINQSILVYNTTELFNRSWNAIITRRNQPGKVEKVRRQKVTRSNPTTHHQPVNVSFNLNLKKPKAAEENEACHHDKWLSSHTPLLPAYLCSLSISVVTWNFGSVCYNEIVFWHFWIFL